MSLVNFGRNNHARDLALQGSFTILILCCHENHITVARKARNLYICPGGKELKTSGSVHDGSTIKYIAKRSDCAICPLKPQGTTGRERRISRDVNQDARDYTQALMQSEAYGVSSTDRKKIETLFGEVKHTLSLVRLRLRGLSGARDEFLLTATVQNLKRLAQHSTIPPPQPSAA